MTSLHLSHTPDDQHWPTRWEPRSEEERRQHVDRRDDPPDPPRTMKIDLKTILAIISLVSAIFTAGYNWRDVVALREVVKTNESENQLAHEGFVRKDVNDQHFESVQRQLNDQKALLEQIIRGQQRIR